MEQRFLYLLRYQTFYGYRLQADFPNHLRYSMFYRRIEDGLLCTIQVGQRLSCIGSFWRRRVNEFKT